MSDGRCYAIYQDCLPAFDMFVGIHIKWQLSGNRFRSLEANTTDQSQSNL